MDSKMLKSGNLKRETEFDHKFLNVNCDAKKIIKLRYIKLGLFL